MYNFEKIQFTNEVDFMKMEMWLNFFGKVVIAAAIIVAAILIVKAINAKNNIFFIRQRICLKDFIFRI